MNDTKSTPAKDGGDESDDVGIGELGEAYVELSPLEQKKLLRKIDRK